MALQVWLPLTKDTNNYGLSQIGSPTVNGLTANTSGKLGGCYKGYSLYHLSEDIIDNEWTIAAWVKSDSWGQYNDIIFCKNVSASNDCQIYFSIVSGNTLNIGINGPSGSMTYGYTFSTNTWYHIAATYNGSKCVMYINGTKVKEGTDTTAKPTGRLNICVGGRSTNTGGTSVTGMQSYINDLRLYDNALSPREVAEIAKGLVLHYPLNRDGFGLDNILKTTYTLASNWGTNQGTISNGVATITPTSDSSRRIFQTPAMGGWSWQASTTYTVSVEARSDDGAKLIIGPYGSGAADSSVMTVTSKWKRYSYTFTSTASPSTSSLSLIVSQTSGVTLQIRRPKMEISSVATPWIPNPTDADYTALGFDDGIEYDVSGFERNGTKSNMAYSSDTARYHTSSVFNKQTSRVLIPNIWNTSVKNPEITFAFWMKRDDYDDLYPHYMYNDICSIYMYPNDQYAGNGYGLRISWKHDTASSSNGNTWATSRTIPADEWHHVCFTTKDGVMKLYIDGVMHSGINDRSSTGQYIGNHNNGFLGYRLNNGEVWSYGGELSDFRIYATALTADQVKQLYEAPISLANNGTLFANEFNET